MSLPQYFGIVEVETPRWSRYSNLVDLFAMKALVFHGKGDIRVEDVDEPKCSPGRVKVSIQNTGPHRSWD